MVFSGVTQYTDRQTWAAAQDRHLVPDDDGPYGWQEGATRARIQCWNALAVMSHAIVSLGDTQVVCCRQQHLRLGCQRQGSAAAAAADGGGVEGEPVAVLAEGFGRPAACWAAELTG